MPYAIGRYDTLTSAETALTVYGKKELKI